MFEFSQVNCWPGSMDCDRGQERKETERWRESEYERKEKKIEAQRMVLSVT